MCLKCGSRGKHCAADAKNCWDIHRMSKMTICGYYTPFTGKSHQHFLNIAARGKKMRRKNVNELLTNGRDMLE